MNKLILLFLTLTFLISCNSSSEEPLPPEIEGGDIEAPEIAIPTFPEVVETTSSFQISVTDESNITTQIYIDDILVAESATSAIDFDIDPFDFTVGDKTLRILSTDANDNVETVNIPFELKKLLFRLPEPVSDNAFPGSYVFLSVNFSDGSLYKSKRIESDEDGTFYADDNFERQDFVVSLYRISDSFIAGNNYYFIYTFSDISPGTELLNSTQRFDFFNLGALRPDEETNFDLTEIPNSRIFGYNGYMFPGTYELDFNSGAPQKYLLYNFPDFGNTQTDYSYTLITDLNKTTYTLSDLSPANDFSAITLPQQSEFYLKIEGYENEEDYDHNRYHQFFDGGNHSISTNTINIPLFPNLFNIYNLFYTTTINNKLTFSRKQKGMTSPVITDDLQIIKNDQNISIDGEHDYSKIWFRDHSFDVPNTFSNYFDWKFYNKESVSVEILMESFEIPQAVLTLYEERGVLPRPSQQTDNNFRYNLEVYDHSDEVIYENMMFGGDYNQNEGGDVIWLTYDLKD